MDFCKQCSISVLGKDRYDLVSSDPEAKPTERYLVTCDGCYLPSTPKHYTVVDKDGTCVVDCNLHHGTETVEDWKRMGAIPS